VAGCEYSRFAKDWRYLGFLPFVIRDQFYPDLQGRKASVGPERFCENPPTLPVAIEAAAVWQSGTRLGRGRPGPEGPSWRVEVEAGSNYH
jgi:hypothetical protein